MNQEKISEMIMKLELIPSRIAKHSVELLDLNEKLQESITEINQLESAIKSSVNSAEDANGKKLYSNAEAREAAFLQIAFDDEDLKRSKEVQAELQRKISLERIQIEALSNEQRNARTIVQYFSSLHEV
jgi:hypothetical protein